jgi:hypothetical protein
MLVLALISEVFLLTNSLKALTQFAENKDAIVASGTAAVPYSEHEVMLKEKFDKFFFGASSSCKGLLCSYYTRLNTGVIVVFVLQRCFPSFVIFLVLGLG